MAVILLGGLVFRVKELNNPVDYDEAYTVVEFSSRSFWTLISDYSLPNNHIFHSLLVKISLFLFGMHPWSIRIPALLAGMGIVFAAYLLGKKLYSTEAGLAAAALTAYLPEMVRYASQARGYSLLSLDTLLSLLLALAIIREAKARHWVLLTLISAFGLWTIPLMLYPAGAIYIWLLLEGPINRKYFFSWLLSGLGTGALALLLYSPALLVSGWRKVFDNGFVQPVNETKYYDWLLLNRLENTFKAWTFQVPQVLILLLAIGLILSFVIHLKNGKTRLHPLFVILGWCAFLILIRRPEVYDRFWSWLVAPLLVFSAGGLIESLRWLVRNRPPFQQILRLLTVGSLTIAAVLAMPETPAMWRKTGNAQAAAQFMVSHQQPGDVILAGYPNDAPIWYYLLQSGTPRETWQAQTSAKRYLIALASNQKDQTLEKIIKSYKLDPAKINCSSTVPQSEFGKIKIYPCLPIP